LRLSSPLFTMQSKIYLNPVFSIFGYFTITQAGLENKLVGLGRVLLCGEKFPWCVLQGQPKYTNKMSTLLKQKRKGMELLWKFACIQLAWITSVFTSYIFHLLVTNSFFLKEKERNRCLDGPRTHKTFMHIR
jgi:hypothetical protein